MVINLVQNYSGCHTMVHYYTTQWHARWSHPEVTDVSMPLTLKGYYCI